MSLTKEQLERYSRNILVKEIGTEGQEKLSSSSVLIIGLGGLGSPAALYLAAAGIGRLGLADADAVELSNLQRQVIHTTKDIGRAKVESAKEKINALNPDTEVITHNAFLDRTSISDVISGYDFIVDATDNYASKFLINDACVMADKPFVHAAILGFYGELMTVLPHKTPCYRCLYPAPPADIPSLTDGKPGVIGAMPGVIGSLEALEAIKFILGKGELCTGKLMIIDALSMDFDQITLLPRGDDCPVCSDHPRIKEL